MAPQIIRNPCISAPKQTPLLTLIPLPPTFLFPESALRTLNGTRNANGDRSQARWAIQQKAPRHSGEPERNTVSKKKILIITGDGGETYEVLYAKHRFMEAGYEPVIAAQSK